MAAVFAEAAGDRLRGGLVAGPAPGAGVAPPLEWITAGHPVPDAGSLAAGRRALAIAAGMGADDCLVVLLSGGASALLTAPAVGLTLGDLQATNRQLLRSGADIEAVNTIRRHLSAIKGGWLAVSAAGATRAFVASDVVGDDLSAIGSGPTVPDATTFNDALATAERFGGLAAYPEPVVRRLVGGARGEFADTPKPGDTRLARSWARVIGGRRDAIEGARREAEALGYAVRLRPDPVVGEARVAAPAHVATAGALLDGVRRPACVLSAGETTVRVTGGGKGGRNQEFALAAVGAVERLGPFVVAASIGTDGIDGPTDAAGGIVDTTTRARAQAAGLAPAGRYLDDNNAYAYFAALDDLVLIGPTDTNVGDLQAILVGDEPPADPVAGRHDPAL